MAERGMRSRRERQSALLLDLYQLTMGQSYFAEDMHLRPATFSLFVRHLPAGWGYLVAAGLDDVLGYLEDFSFAETELAYLAKTRLFTDSFLRHLADLRFEGDVRAMPESRGPGLSSRLVTRSHARRQAGPDRRPYGRADRRPAAPG